jgi:DNA polymerase-2
MEPQPGIYQNVLVLDFKSLYPSIIKTFNIDPSSFLEKKEKNCIQAPNGACFENKEGILPEIIDGLHKEREKAKKEKNELRSYGIKIIMNSFFGVLASPNCRYFNMDMANAITTFGQKIIKLTAEKIKEKGHDVLYSDTDSVFVHTTKIKSESEEIGKKIERDINNFYQEHIKKEYNRKSFIELEYEKIYLSLLMPELRGKKTGAKKRYAGLIKKDNKEKLEIVGLEAIRGDWTEAAQEFQKKLLDKVFHKKNVKKFIKRYVSDLKKGKLDKKLIYGKSIRKNLNEYVKTTPPHVKAARKQQELKSNLIEYYITSDGPEPVQNKKHSIDYPHYIEKQIKPIAETILSLLDIEFEEVLSGSRQTTL